MHPYWNKSQEEKTYICLQTIFTYSWKNNDVKIKLKIWFVNLIGKCKKTKIMKI